LPLGDRRAIDALIATHGVVMDPQHKTIWVSQSPHLLGQFVAFPLEELARAAAGEVPPRVETIPADPLLHEGR
jgi:hypothetical protein